MFGEMSWDVGIQAPWIVGSGSRNTETTVEAAEISSSHGWVYNVKAIRYAPNSRKNSEPDGSELPGKANDPVNGYVALTEESLGSNHPGGTHVVMADGSGMFIHDDIDVEKVLLPMTSRNSGDVYDRPL